MLRFYSYLYHLGLALFLLGLSIVALLSSNVLRIPILPWSGPVLTQFLLWGSLTGLLSIVLAFTGIFRYLFPIWCFAVVVIFIRGYLLQPIPFSGKDDFQTAMLLTAGSVLAFLASLTLFTLRPRRA